MGITMDYTNQITPTATQAWKSEKLVSTALAILSIGAPGDAIALQQGFEEPTWGNSIAQSKQQEAIEKSSSLQAGDSIKLIRELCGFNVTELAGLFGVTRPTVYNWIKGGEVKKDISAKLQVLEAVAKHWASVQGAENLSFLMDYNGPRANDISIRKALSEEVIETNEMTSLIDQRINEYTLAAEESRKIIGDVELVKGAKIPDSDRRLNELWSANIKKLKRSQNKEI